MRTHSICLTLACVALLLLMGTSAGFGWGTATHVFFANHLGVHFGTLNQNEIYGATLNDIFGYSFTDAEALYWDYLLHTDPTTLMGLYQAAQSPAAKAAFYGVFTHNNFNEKIFANMRGADWYAHGVYPFPGDAPDPKGWVISQGKKLVSNNQVIEDYLVNLLHENAPYFAPVVGHTLIETAVDVLVKRNEDCLVGARLYLAAKNRTNEIPIVLENAFSPKAAAAEAIYREQMMGYGQLFMLPENLLINMIAQQTVDVANLYLAAVGYPTYSVIEAADIAGFIRIAIQQVKPLYHAELMATLHKVEDNMKNGPPPAGPVFAFWKDGAMAEDLAELNIQADKPTEFALDQNYPNPFNPTTNIAYAIPVDSRITLKVYNSIGQEVATLVDEDRPAGQYVATWNATGLSSGTYFYRIQAGSTVLTKKMVLLK